MASLYNLLDLYEQAECSRKGAQWRLENAARSPQDKLAARDSATRARHAAEIAKKRYYDAMNVM